VVQVRASCFPTPPSGNFPVGFACSTWRTVFATLTLFSSTCSECSGRRREVQKFLRDARELLGEVELRQRWWRLKTGFLFGTPFSATRPGLPPRAPLAFGLTLSISPRRFRVSTRSKSQMARRVRVGPDVGTTCPGQRGTCPSGPRGKTAQKLGGVGRSSIFPSSVRHVDLSVTGALGWRVLFIPACQPARRHCERVSISVPGAEKEDRLPNAFAPRQADAHLEGAGLALLHHRRCSSKNAARSSSVPEVNMRQAVGSADCISL